jgi:hypothetical protein
MRAALIAAALFPLVACGPSADADVRGAADPPSLEGTVYGEAITLETLTPVSAILDDPEAWVGERVLVEGMVVGVCDVKGCWMEIAADREFEKIRVKVDDGVMVFPLEARGRTALVEGVVEKVELTYEQALEQARHEAEEHGETFDPGSVTGPTTTYQIRGLGAIIAD